MFRRGIIVAAVVTYLVVLGCVMWPDRGRLSTTRLASAQTTSGTTRPSLTGLPYRSVGIQIQRVDWIEDYKKCIDEIANVGADTVLLVVDARQENGNSSKIYLDMRATPTPQQLGDAIDHAKKKNLRVILMPIVLLDNPKGTEWRGTLAPESWDDWFDSYRDMMYQFAWVAEAHGVNVLVVGSELVSSEPKVDEWKRTITSIRNVFRGQLTYSSNWDHYTAVPFWDDLDLIGMNSYWKMGKDNKVTVEEIKREWKEKIQPDLFKFQAKVKKPLMFLEVGWCSMANMAYEPWDYTKTEVPIDLDLQKRLYEGFFESWYGNPILGGFSIWAWTPGDGGSDDRGYTPEGKPAEQVLRTWMGKPRWEVK